VRDSSFADLGGEDWAKTVPPEPDGLIADIDATLGGQKILDVPQRSIPAAIAGMRDLNEGQKIAYEVVADRRTGKSSAGKLKQA
jgi:hypothetical protein